MAEWAEGAEGAEPDSWPSAAAAAAEEGPQGVGDAEGIVEVRAGGGVEVWCGAWGRAGAGGGGAARPSSVRAMEMGLLGVDSTRSPIRDAASDRLA